MKVNSRIFKNGKGLSNNSSVISTILAGMSTADKDILINAEVIDVILSKDHPEYNGDNLRAIKFRYINKKSTDDYTLAFALPLDSSDNTAPLKHEIVPILVFKNKFFYMNNINFYNNNISNELPEVSTFENTSDDLELGDTFDKTIIQTKNIETSEGSKLLMSRFGSFCYFTDNDNSPQLIIGNTAKETIDINTVDVGQLHSTKGKISFKFITKYFTTSSTFDKNYDGSQSIFNAGRIILNAYNNVIGLFSNKDIILNTNRSVIMDADDDININSNNVNIQSKQNAIYNAKEIYIGDNAEDPIVLGNKLNDMLSAILDELISLTVATGTGASSVPINVMQFKKIQQQLNTILSKKTKVE